MHNEVSASQPFPLPRASDPDWPQPSVPFSPIPLSPSSSSSCGLQGLSICYRAVLGAVQSARARFGPVLHTSCQLCGSLSQCVPLLYLPSRKSGDHRSGRGWPEVTLSSSPVLQQLSKILGWDIFPPEKSRGQPELLTPTSSMSKSVSLLLRTLFQA